MKSKYFFPRNKPKLWILCVGMGLAGLIVTSPFIVSGIVFNVFLLVKIAVVLLQICWTISVVSGVLCWINYLNGEYKNLENKSWKEQKW